MQRSEEKLGTRQLASASDSATGRAPVTDGGAQGSEDASDAKAQGDAARQTQDAGAPLTQDAGAPLTQDAGAPGSRVETAAPGSDVGGPLLDAELTATFRQRWEEVQARFVDEPRGAVEDADGLVASVMQQLAEGFAQEREQLEAQWDRGEDISTEDLRVALQRYRSFFHRLLST